MYGLETSQDRISVLVSPKKNQAETPIEQEVRIFSGEPILPEEQHRLVDQFFELFDTKDDMRAPTKEAFSQFINSVKTLDRDIESAQTSWRVDRMSVVDRNIIRLAIWEKQRKRSLSTAQIIQHAQELADRYGSETSATYVTGVLNGLLSA